MPGQDVIQRQVRAALSAVLAGEVVTGEDLAAGESGDGARALDVVDHADHAGDVERPCDRAQRAISLRDDFRFATFEQHERASGVADVEGFIVLVEHQDRRVDEAHGGGPPAGLVPKGGIVPRSPPC
jgi:hypothetical protein